MTATRTPQVVREIQSQLAELSGLSIEELDPAATFLELGFDSLFLAQANGALKKRFGVRMSVRQLMETTPSIASLAEHLEGKLPDDFFAAEAPAPVTAPAANAAPSGVATAPPSVSAALPFPPMMGSAPVQSTGPGGGLQELIQQQLLLMQEQLRWLSGEAHAAAVAPAADAPAMVAQPDVATPAPGPESFAPIAAKKAVGAGTDERGRAQGPWRPADRAKDRQHGQLQRQAIDALADRLEAQCPASKRYAQEHRRTLADPRGVTGFKSDWKELIFQVVAAEAKGAHIRDIDGNDYVDMVGSYGVNFLGHSPDYIERAVRAQLESGFAIGPQTTLAGEVAALVSELTGMERVTFCNTGSEAVLAALRVVRTITGNDRVATFAGHYHGIFDEVLLRTADVGGTRRNFPIAPGIPQHAVEQGLVLDYGDPASLDLIREHADELACVILEPVRSRNPDLQPWDFVRELRALTRELRIPLIFDEMITGFRSHLGGAQALLGIEADLATYGKVLAGGFPIGVVAGKAEYMDALDGGYWSYGDDSVPEADMTWFAGTFVRHPISMAAAKASLTYLKEQGPGLQDGLNARTSAWVGDMNAWFEANNVPIWLEHFSSFFLVTYTEYQEYSDLLPQFLLTRGVYSRETRPLFWSIAHADEDWQRVADAYKESVLEMQAAGLLTGRRGEIVPITPELEKYRLPVRPKKVALTEPQRELWVATRFGAEASAAFNVSLKLHLHGDVEVESMRRSLQALVDRHEALRVTIDPEGEEQTIHPEVKLDVPLVDFSDSPQEERPAAADAYELEEVKRPFDLEEGPLVRARILKLGDDRWRVFMVAHHIVVDGWSCGILSRDLGKIYSAIRNGQEPQLNPVMQLSEYVSHLHTEESLEAREASARYWLAEFDSVPDPLDLPTDRPRPAIKSYPADRVAIQIEPDVVQELRAAATRHGSTFFAFGFAAFAAFVARLTGQHDFVVASDLAGQALVPGKDLVAHAVSFLPIRMQVDASRPFSELLAATRGKWFDIIENQSYTYGTLLQNIKVPQDQSRLPLFSVSYNLDPSSLGVEMEGVEAVIDSVPRQFENNDMFVNLVQLDHGGIELQCTYTLALFEEETVVRRMHELVNLMVDAARRPDVPVSALALATAEEKHLLLEAWNDTVTDRALDTPVHRLIEAQVERSPDAVAVIAEAGVAESLTYRELNERADALAARLQSFGVGAGTPVLVTLERSVELLVAILAVLKSGGAYVPVDPSYPEGRRRFMIEDSGTELVLTQTALVEGMPDGPTIIAVDEIWHELTTGRPAARSSPEDLAYVIYTSGSTGTPKGAMVEHRSIVNQLLWLQQEFALTDADVFLQRTPISFDPSALELFSPLLVGGTLVMPEPESHVDPSYLVRTIREHGVTVLIGVPSLLQALLTQPDLEGCTSLRAITCGGEVLTPDLRDRVLKLLDARLLNAYGPAETSVIASFHDCRLGDPQDTVPIGRPVANTRLYVMDAGGEIAPIGVPGELHIGGPQVARGYINRTELSEDRFIADPFSPDPEARLYRTGDLCRYRPDGQLDFLGRRDHQVKIRGFRIELGEVEAVLERQAGVGQAVVTVKETSPGDQSLVAYLVPGNGSRLDAGELSAALKSTLPEYMVPLHWVVLAQLPQNESGKVDLTALPMPDRSARSERNFVEPRTNTERVVSAIWQEVLGVSRVGATDDFFDLGGHSILAIRVVSRIRRDLGVDLPLRKFFAARVVSAVAGEIDGLAVAALLGSDAETPEAGEEVVF